jgi:hypothetical protein
LYAVPVRDEIFSYTKTVIDVDDFASSILSLNYDNVNNLIFALNFIYDSTFSVAGTNVVSIDPENGEVTTRGELSEFMGFVMGSACFDQFSASYIVIGIDTNYAAKMIVFDTYTNNYITGWVPDGVSEIVCDNSSFAMSNYIITDVPEAAKDNDFRVFPNPADTRITISDFPQSSGKTMVSVFSVDGKELIYQEFQNESSIDIDISHLRSGIYILRTDNQAVKLMVN